MHLAKVNIDLYLTKKREAKAVRKRLRFQKRRISLVRAELDRLNKKRVFGARSIIVSMLCGSNSQAFALSQTSLYLPVPATFSMLAEPETAISLVGRFASTFQGKLISEVHVDMLAVTKQDLGAHALLDKLVDEIESQSKFQNVRMGWRGTFPKDPALTRFIKSMGILRRLRLTNKYLQINEAQKIHLFERRCRHYIRDVRSTNPLEKTEQSNAAERFANHINNCLKREGKVLTKEGRSRLCTYVVEVIDNAENHAGMVDWTIQGYVDMAMEHPECEIVIFNFGKSIAETMDSIAPDSYTMDQIRLYLETHSRQGWFSPTWRREDLLTLIALQGSVSSKNSVEDPTRGQGTADLIEFFQEMNRERVLENESAASMYIISGGTRVLFSPKYQMVRKEDGSRTLAFNDTNDLLKPPDRAFVMPLKNGARLPGTMIGIKFKIQPAALESGDTGNSQ